MERTTLTIDEQIEIAEEKVLNYSQPYHEAVEEFKQNALFVYVAQKRHF